MHFRQRVAWLLLAFYLIATAGCLYYIFEISAWFGMFALEHADENHPEIGSPLRSALSSVTETVKDGNIMTEKGQLKTKLWTLMGHIVDLPQPLIILLLLAIYLQVFCSLWMFTRSETYCFTSCLWPVIFCSSLTSLWRFGARYRGKYVSPSLSNASGFKYTTYDL